MMRVIVVGLIVATSTLAQAAPRKKARAPKPAQVVQPSAPAVTSEPAPYIPPSGSGSAFGDTTKIKVAVMDLRSGADIPPELAASMTQLIPQELSRMGPFTAVAMQDVLQMINFESVRQGLGCDSTSCFAEIGGALGADYLVSGNLVVVGGSYLLQLQLMNMHDNQIAARVARDYTGPASGLLDEVRVATRLLMRDILVAQSGRLAILTAEEGATITVDDAVVGVTPMQPFSLGAGMHTVRLEKTGFIRFARDVAINPDQDTRLDAVLQPSAEFARAYRDKAAFTRKLAWGGVIVGGAALVTAGVLFAKGSGDASDLRDDINAYNASGLRDSATARALDNRSSSIGTLDTVTLITGTVGVAALATGIVLFVTGDDPSRYDIKTSVQPNVAIDGHGGAFFALSGKF